jgi:hypothetical protein
MLVFYLCNAKQHMPIKKQSNVLVLGVFAKFAESDY